MATIVALALSGLLLLGLMGAGVYAASRIGDRVLDGRGPVADVQERQRDGMPGRGNGQGDGDGMMRGNGSRYMLPGVGMLGMRVQHGEVTVTGTDGAPVALLVQRGLVTSASATSLAVRSDDGFAQTYTVNDGTRVGGGSAATLASGDEVFVVARKDGRVALQVLRLRGR